MCRVLEYFIIYQQQRETGSLTHTHYNINEQIAHGFAIITDNNRGGIYALTHYTHQTLTRSLFISFSTRKTKPSILPGHVHFDPNRRPSKTYPNKEWLLTPKKGSNKSLSIPFIPCPPRSSRIRFHTLISIAPLSTRPSQQRGTSGIVGPTRIHR